MFRSRSWFSGGWGKPKNAHSLEHLKYLHNVLAKNQNVSEQNRGLLVESLRFIAEILIWGDQNDSSVFDFFLEKNMLSYFLRIMRQRSGGSSFVCVQLLQTLNILFENIRNETSLYYLLSNNHVNSIIVHKFDFSDEEVMAYYISFLKTLSLKLNNHTIHFFYNENTKDFPLYTEAIKFFNHPETMVRIAVRTLTLNVYRVQDASMLRFIRDRTAAPYFSNLVWFIGKHVLELDSCVRNDADHQSQRKLDNFVAEHLDHLHYINDILCLNIPDLNDVLTEHLLHKLLIPLYIYSLTTDSTTPPSNNLDPQNREQIQNIETIRRNLAALLKHKSVELSPEKQSPFQSARSESREENRPSVSCVVSLFLLSQVFLIITHGPIVHALAWIILQSDLTVFEEGATKILEMYLKNKKACVKLEFSKPSITLEKALECSTATYHLREYRTSSIDRGSDMNMDSGEQSSCDLDPDLISNSLPSTSQVSEASSVRNESTEDLITEVYNEVTDINGSSLTLANVMTIHSSDSPLPDMGNVNITDEEKEKIASVQVSPDTIRASAKRDNLETRLRIEIVEIEKKPFLKTVFDSMDCMENDYKALFALCLIFALINNKGVNTELLDQLLYPAGCSGAAAVAGTEVEASHGEDSEEAPPPTIVPTPAPSTVTTPAPSYNALFLDRLLSILNLSCKPNSKVRLVTLELVCVLLGAALGVPARRHAQLVHTALSKATHLLQAFYKSDDIFLDMFEDEYCKMCKCPLNVEWLCMDAAILLPPTRTPMSGIAFAKRLPSGEEERARRAIRGYFLIRTLWLKLMGRPETQLPLSYPTPFEEVGNVLDLKNMGLQDMGLQDRPSPAYQQYQHCQQYRHGQPADSDLISCDITQKDGTWHHRFLAIYPTQIILVEPDKQRLGWGVAKLVGSLQDLEIQGDKEDPRCLHLTIHKPTSVSSGGVRDPLLRAKFKFDDHIRSMAAKQRLTKGRTKSRQKKMQQIARLLELPGATTSRAGVAIVVPSQRSHKPLFTAAARHPGFAALRRESTGSSERTDGTDHRARPTAQIKDGVVVYRDRSARRDNSAGGSKAGSRDTSPRPEDIPLSHIRTRSPHAATSTTATRTVQSHPHLGSAHASRSSSIERPPPMLSRRSSEETSFIAHASKRKGYIETV